MTVALCNIIDWSNTANENIQPKRKQRVNTDFHRFLVCPKHPMNAFCHKGDDPSWTG